ncbi:MAG: hypothetical protein ACRELB_15850 [Polyangiaceae bacterium]
MVAKRTTGRAAAAGLELTRVIRAGSPTSLVEARAKQGRPVRGGAVDLKP